MQSVHITISLSFAVMSLELKTIRVSQVPVAFTRGPRVLDIKHFEFTTLTSFFGLHR